MTCYIGKGQEADQNAEHPNLPRERQLLTVARPEIEQLQAEFAQYQ